MGVEERGYKYFEALPERQRGVYDVTVRIAGVTEL